MPLAFPNLRLLFALGLAMACLLVYFPGLSGGFIFDDFPNIVTNSRLRFEDFSLSALRTAAGAYEGGIIGRPLATLGFALDLAIGGKNAWVFKVHSLIVHTLNALLVLALATRLLALPRSLAPWPAWAPFAIALAWAVHPLQVSTVLYVVQRMEMLALTFVLLSLLAYLRGRLRQREGQAGWGWLILSGLLAGVGALSKESAALFPVYALMLELTLLGFDCRAPRTRKILKGLYLTCGLLAGLGFMFWILPANLSPEAYSIRDFTVYERLLTQLRVLPMYLGQMLLPLPNSMPFYYDAYPPSTGWLSPATTLSGGLFLAALLAVGWLLRRRVPLAALGIFWFFSAHLLTSNVVALELVFEHRNYFALLGVLLAVAALLRLVPIARMGSAAAVATSAVLVGVALLGAIRAATWGHPLVLASDLVARSPYSVRASSDLATLYASLSDNDSGSPFHQLAQQEYERGAKLPNASPLPEQGLIVLAGTAGIPAKQAWWDSLILKIQVRPIGPQEMMAVTGLMAQHRDGVPVDALRLSQAYAELLARGGMPPGLYVQYGEFAAFTLDDDALAERLYFEAVENPATDERLVLRMLLLLQTRGRSEQAHSLRERALTLGRLAN